MISTTRIRIKNAIETSHLESDVLPPRAYKPSFNISLEDPVDYQELVKGLLEQFLCVMQVIKSDNNIFCL